METKSTEAAQYKKLSIKDIRTILSHLLYVAITGFATIVVVAMFFADSTDDAINTQNLLIALSISSTLFIVGFLMLKAEWSGYVADPNKIKLTIPGKGLLANSVLDYVNPNYWFRYFRRIDVDFEKLQQISTSLRSYNSILSKLIAGEHKAPKTTWFYDINLSLTDGTYRLTFKSKNKREQLYAMIVQINEMGSPILNR